MLKLISSFGAAATLLSACATSTEGPRRPRLNGGER